MLATNPLCFRTLLLIHLYFLILISGVHAQDNQIIQDEEQVFELNRQASEQIIARNYEEARHLIDQALSASREINSFEGEAEATFHLGSYYESRGLPDSTIIHLAENLDKFIDSGIAIQMGNALGTAYMSTGRYQEGLEIYLDMLELAKERGDERMQLGITLNLGNGYRNLGDMPYAIDSFLQALDQAEQRQDTLIIALALNNLASINTYQQNYELSEEYLSQALNLNIASGNTRNMISNYISLGSLYRVLKNFEASYEMLQNGLQLAEDNGILLPRIQILHHLGNLYMAFDQFDKALPFFDESYRLSRENNIISGYFHNQMSLGSAHEKMGEYDTALSIFEQALEIAEEAGSTEQIQGALENLYRISAATGDTISAFTYLQRYNANTDSLAQTRREEALAQQEAVLGFRLEQENRMALEAAYQNEHRNFLIAAMLMVLLIILLIAVAWLYLKKREANELLQKKAKELTRVNNLKDSLLNVLAHDLRTPLSNLKGVVFLIRQKALDRNVIHETLDDIETRLQQGINTLTNYLQWARGQWEGIEVHLAPLNLFDHIESAIQEVAGLAKIKDITILNKVDEDAVVIADSQLLLVILRNLLSNAVKFSHREGLVTIHTEKVKKHTFISVTDHGVGIPLDKQPHLFKPLVYTAEGTDGEPGTGLGLSICKDFAEKQNGKISVKSVPGKGSAFTLQLDAAVSKELPAKSVRVQTA